MQNPDYHSVAITFDNKESAEKFFSFLKEFGNNEQSFRDMRPRVQALALRKALQASSQWHLIKGEQQIKIK